MEGERNDYHREPAQDGAGLGGKRGFSCSKYLADEFGIECGEVSCGECYARLFERIADRIEDETDEPRDMVREPQLPEGVEWPRFEDGELVKFGDEVEFEGETWNVTGIGFESPGFDIGLRCGLNIGAMSGSYGERLKRPKPKVLDADGAPIEVGDAVYFVGGSGTRFAVKDIDFKPDGAFVDIIDEDRYSSTVNPESLTHERPDSWERIENDAKLAPRDYLEKRGMNPDKTERIIASMIADLVRRAKALAKAGE